MFEDPLHVGRPNVVGRTSFLQRINEALDRRQLSNGGPLLRELEEQLAKRLEVEHCIAVCNGSLGLQVAVRALGFTGEVIVPAFTFVATAHALEWLGLEPIFCDVDPVTHTLDPQDVERAITPKTSAVVGVHLWGRVCDTEALGGIVAEHGLRLLFDAAHAFGVAKNGRKVGSFGDCEVMSFHATKLFHTFEGGAITTNDPVLARNLRLMINHGFSGFDNVVSVGTNAKMSELAAAMGLAQLEHFDEIVEHNQTIHRLYERRLQPLEGLKLLEPQSDATSNFQFVVCEIDASASGISRDRVLEILHAENVLARRYFYPGCHRMMPYRDRPAPAHRALQGTEALCERVLCLPTGMAMDAGSVDRICDLLSFVLSHGRELARQPGAGAP